MKIFYFCDGEDKECTDKSWCKRGKESVCYKYGGPCKYTSKIEHARYFCLKEIGNDKAYVELRE